MSKAKSVLIRFHTEHANEKAAYDKLAALQEQTHLSQSQIVAAALNAYSTLRDDKRSSVVALYAAPKEEVYAPESMIVSRA